MLGSLVTNASNIIFEMTENDLLFCEFVSWPAARARDHTSDGGVKQLLARLLPVKRAYVLVFFQTICTAVCDNHP